MALFAFSKSVLFVFITCFYQILLLVCLRYVVLFVVYAFFGKGVGGYFYFVPLNFVAFLMSCAM